MELLAIGAAGALGVGVLVGLGKMWIDARRWHAEQQRAKKPWERDPEDFSS